MKYRNTIKVEAWRVSAETRHIIKDELGEKVWWYDSNGDDEGYIDSSDLPDYSNNCATAGTWIIRHPTQGLSIMSNEDFQSTYEPSLP